MAGIQWVEFEIIESIGTRSKKQPTLNHGTFLHGCISSENSERQTHSIALYYTNESYEVKLCCLLMISIVFWLMNLLLMSMQIHYSCGMRGVCMTKTNRGLERWLARGGGNRGRAKKRLELAVSVSWDTCAASATGKKLGKTTQTPPLPRQSSGNKQCVLRKSNEGQFFPKPPI